MMPVQAHRNCDRGIVFHQGVDEGVRAAFGNVMGESILVANAGDRNAMFFGGMGDHRFEVRHHQIVRAKVQGLNVMTKLPDISLAQRIEQIYFAVARDKTQPLAPFKLAYGAQPLLARATA